MSPPRPSLRLMLFTVLAAIALLAAVPIAAHALPLHADAWTALGGVALATAPVATTASVFDGIIPAALVGREKRTFFAQLAWTPIAAGAAVPGQLVADNNHDIVIHRLSYTARDSGTKAMLDRPPLFAEIALVNGEILTPIGVPVELENIAGVNRGTPELVIPIVIPAGETFQIILTNGAAVAADVRVALIGFRSRRQAR